MRWPALVLLLAASLLSPTRLRADACEHAPLVNVAYPVEGDEDVPLNPFLGPFELDCGSATCLEGPDGPVPLWQTEGHTWARHYRPLVARNPRHRVGRAAWLFLYVFVAIQSAWVLRPFVGAPGLPTRFFREGAWSNAYVMLVRSVWDLVTSR